MVQYFPVITGSLTVQGNVLITGSINTTAGITGSFSGTATTALTASSVANLNQNVVVTGSLTTTGQIVAQTLNVQQVTSSIVFSSGSNVFGSSTSNTQQMTGSVLITGSLGINTTSLTERLTVVGSGLFGSTGAGSYSLAISNNDQSNVRFRLTNTGTGGQSFSIVGGNPGTSNTGLAIYDETNSATRLYVSSSGNVGIGTSSPVGPLMIAVPATGAAIGATNAQTAYDYSRLRIKHYTDSNLGLSIGYAGANYTYIQTGYNEGSTSPLLINPFGGNVGIGTTSAGDVLDVQKNQNATTNFYFQNTNTTNTNSRAYVNVISGTTTLLLAAITGDNTYVKPTNSTGLYLGYDNALKITSGGNLEYTLTPNAYYHIATDLGKISVASGGTLNFGSFSGLIMVNNHSNGYVGIFLCGAGTTSLVSYTGSTSGLGTLTYNGGINGYTWTSNLGGTAFYGFFVVRTRANA
jgi:hypothetical protein